MSRKLLLFGTALLTSCATDPTCDICLTEAIVYGRVTTAGGIAAFGVPVLGQQLLPDCGGQAVDSWAPGSVTDSNGDYRIEIRVWHSPGPRCAVVQFAPGAGSGLSAGADTVASLYFRPTWTGSERRDSARVDIVLGIAP